MTESFQHLRRLADERWAELHSRPWIRVSTGLLGMAAGAGETLAALHAELARSGVQATVSEVGSTGLCYAEPLVDVYVPNGPRVIYGKVGAESLRRIVEEHVKDGEPVMHLALASVDTDVPRLPRREQLP